MAQFLRPDGDVTSSLVTGSFADLDEAVASDADRAFGSVDGTAILEVSLGNPTGTPAAGTCTVRYRAAKVTSAGALSGTGGSASILAELYQGASLVAADTARSPAGSYAAFSFTFSAASVTDWSDLRVRLTFTGTGSGNPGNRRTTAVSWVEVETTDAAPIEQKSGSFAVSQGHSAATSGQKGAIAAWAESHGHSVTAAGTSQRVASFAESHDHTVEVTGSKTSEEQPGASGSFDVSHGHSVDVSGVKHAVGSFAVEMEVDAAVVGSKATQGEWSIDAGIDVSVAGSKQASDGWSIDAGILEAFQGAKQGVGSFTSDQGHTVLVDGQTARFGSWVISHGHALSISGGANPPEVHSGEFSVEHEIDVSITGAKTVVAGGFAIAHGHALDLAGEGARAGGFAISHGHSVSASGQAGQAEERSGPWAIEHGIDVTFSGSVRRPFQHRVIGGGPTRDVPGPIPPYAIPRREV